MLSLSRNDQANLGTYRIAIANMSFVASKFSSVGPIGSGMCEVKGRVTVTRVCSFIYLLFFSLSQMTRTCRVL